MVRLQIIGGLTQAGDIYLEKDIFTTSDYLPIGTASILGRTENKIVNKTTAFFKQT